MQNNIAAQNRKARHDYNILEEYEAGICLNGTEVKSLRTGKANIVDAYADIRDDAVWLLNSYIPEYKNASNYYNHNPRRERKLLLHKREIKKLFGKVKEKGLTLIALSIYFNKKGLAKVKLALCSGKTKYDKRQTIKERDWQRQKSRTLKGEEQ